MNTSLIYKMAQAGKILAYIVSRQWRLKKNEIDSWVEKKKNKK